MLRNKIIDTSLRKLGILNEVLSLNAQEYVVQQCRGLEQSAVLNEVLSLNAQESVLTRWIGSMANPQ